MKSRKQQLKQYPIEEAYLVDYDLVKFKSLLEGLVGFITRKYFPGFQQTLERYNDLREDTCLFVLNKLEDEKYKYNPSKGKFVSYCFYLIRWNLTNYFTKFNNERKKCISINNYLYSKHNIIKTQNTIQYNMYTGFIKYNIIKYNIDILPEDAIEYLLHGRKINEKVYELKFLSWLVYKNFILQSNNC